MSTTRNRSNRRSHGILPWLRGQFRRRPRPLWLVCALHAVALGLALVLYALPHHVIPHGEARVGIVSSREAAAQVAEDEVISELDSAPVAEVEIDLPAVEAPAEPVEPAAQTAAASDSAALEAFFGVGQIGDFRSAFPDKFTDGAVEQGANSYRSANLNITAMEKKVDEIDARAYVVDIYIADISCLTTAFAQDKYGRGYSEWITDVAKRYRSVATLNGDYYGSRSTGVIIRNGELYRNKKMRGDICVLYWDGHMETFKSSEFNALSEMDRNPYQSWSFGPSLLDEAGKPLKKFNCDNYLRRKHPRSAIGYFEPGHYCFAVVDGRNDESSGATLTQLATLMSGLGCKLAYNLDGGQTSLLALGSKLINEPSQGGRNSSDYIMIVDGVS